MSIQIQKGGGRESKKEREKVERSVPSKLRLRLGGGGGVGGCKELSPLREMSTSTRDTVSPGRRATRDQIAPRIEERARGGKEGKEGRTGEKYQC